MWCTRQEANLILNMYFCVLVFVFVFVEINEMFPEHIQYARAMVSTPFSQLLNVTLNHIEFRLWKFEKGCNVLGDSSEKTKTY